MRLNLILGIFAFLLLCYTCVNQHMYSIEDDLQSRSAEALAGASISIGNLSLSGRDATLSGPVVSEELRRRAEEVVSRVYGVRTVDNQLTVAALTRESVGISELQQNLDQWIAGKVIGFETASDVVSEQGRTLLDQLVPILEKNTSKIVEIGGHTDAAGNPSRNQDLSRRRAEAVKKHLVSRGLNANLFTAVGYGSTRPVADNATAAGRQTNRRIVLTVKQEK